MTARPAYRLASRAALALLLAAALPSVLSAPAAAQATAPDCDAADAPITGSMSVDATAGTTPQALSDQGFCNGIVFAADGVVNIAEATRNRIGTSTIPAPPATDGREVSVSTGTAATGNPDGRGTLNFSVTATVEGRIGDVLDELNTDGSLRVFKTTPGGRLKSIRITGSASPIVTFTRPRGTVSTPFNRADGVGVGGIGAETLRFETDGEVVLENPGSYQTFYDIGQVTTQTPGQGRLTFKNIGISQFRGHIGEEGQSLNSLTISNRDNTNNKNVEVLGNIYADTIQLNTPRADGLSGGVAGTLYLGDCSGAFGPTPEVTPSPYTVSGNIVTTRNEGGVLVICAYPYHVKGNVGAEGFSLSDVTINGATATLEGAIYTGQLDLTNATVTLSGDNIEVTNLIVLRGNSKLFVNAANQAISVGNRLLLSNSAAGGATLALGTNTFEVGGKNGVASQFRNSVSGKPHTLSFAVAGGASPTSGRLEASTAGVTLPGPDDLTIEIDATSAAVQTANGDRFTLINSRSGRRTSIPAAFDQRILLSRDADPARNNQFAFRLSRNAANTDLLMTTVRAGRAIGEDRPLDVYGEANGVAFGGDHRLRVPAGKTLGQSAGVSLDTAGGPTRGTARFQGAATVAGRVGAVLVDANRSFLARPRGLVKRIEVAGETVTVGGGVGADRVHFSADGTLELNGPADAGLPGRQTGAGLFHRFQATAASDGQGALSFGNRRDAHLVGDLGTAANKLRGLVLAPGAAGAVRMLGDIHAGGIALNGRALTLGNGASASVFSVFDNNRTYRVEAPITTTAGAGALTIRDFNVALQDTVGAAGAALATLRIANAKASLAKAVYARAIDLDARAELALADAVAVSGAIKAQDGLAAAGTLRFAGSATLNGRVGGELAEGAAFTAAPGGLIERIEFEGANQLVTVNGGVGAEALHFAADGTLALNPPAGSSTGTGDVFHRFKASTRNDGEGVLSFGSGRDANVLGTIGAEGNRLKSLILAPGAGQVRVLGDIHAEGIALNERTLTLGNGASAVFGAPERTRTYAINAPITLTDALTDSTTADATTTTAGAVTIRDFAFDLNEPLGALAAPLAAVTITNAVAKFRHDINADAVTVNAGSSGSTLKIARAELSLAGPLSVNDSAQAGVTVDVGANTLRVNGAVSFTGSRDHALALTLGGARHGQVVASGAVAVNTGLRLRVSIENRDAIWNGRSFTIMRGSAPFTPASLAKITVQSPDPGLKFTLARGGPNDTHLLLRATRVRAEATASAPAVAERGDLALVPYYTVAGDWVTGLHIVNTSQHTQVVKLRFRRATDAMDVLDFNAVLPPRDVYAGFLSEDENGAIAWTSPDASCTAPAARGNRLEMPETYRAGAETGYVEIIAMGRASNEDQPIARAAKHGAVSGSGSGSGPAVRPLDCDAVRSNFFPDGAGAPMGGRAATVRKGVQDYATTWQGGSPAASIRAGGLNTYEASGNALKVSYFIRDNATGIELGDNAVHIRDFLANPALTNQQYGVVSGDLNGFDFPDLNGGVPLEKVGTDAASLRRGRFEALRASGALGAGRILNEWSANPANGVEMNWVLTLPGQYLMLRLPQYAAALTGPGRPAPGVDAGGNLAPASVCPRRAIAASGAGAAIPACDYRDLPVTLTFTAYNREQGSSAVAPRPELAVSPGLAVRPPRTYLPRVVNVLGFSGGSGQNGAFPVDARVAADLGQPYGWLSARVSSRDADSIQVCDWDRAEDNGGGGASFPSAAAGRALTVTCSALTNKAVPVIGFAAWSRRVAANPEASYGRIVEHSYRAAATTPTPTTPTPTTTP